MKSKLINIYSITFACFLASCHSSPKVTGMASPQYPLSARFQGIQGTVQVHVLIDSRGAVISAHGSGGEPILVHAAEENASLWAFQPQRGRKGPTPLTITYHYTLWGKPLTVAVPPIVHTVLPDLVEITAVPLESDYPPSSNYTPTPNSKPTTHDSRKPGEF